jgi:peroxiredoxin
MLATMSGGSSADANNAQPVAFTNHVPAAESASNSEKEYSGPAVGDHAPDFQYQSYDAMWQHLHNILEQGDMLLVFGASDMDLRNLERERETLLKTGVIPFVVIEHRDHDVWASVRKLGLTYSLLADPKGAIGKAYGVYDTTTAHSRSAWFVIDTKGRVRQTGTDAPSSSWTAVSANALGRALDGSTQTASTH